MQYWQNWYVVSLSTFPYQAVRIIRFSCETIGRFREHGKIADSFITRLSIFSTDTQFRRSKYFVKGKTSLADGSPV